MTDLTIFDADLVDNTSSIRRLMRWFILSSMAVGFGVGGWAVTAKVDSAVVTAGTFVVKSSAQEVQHPEGGVVAAILVKNGELVHEGQVLIRLDGTKVTADTAILERKLIDLTAQKARLDAERQDRLTIELPRLSLPSPPARGRTEGSARRRAEPDERATLRQGEPAVAAGREQAPDRGAVRRSRQRRRALEEELVQAAAQLKDFRKLEAKQLLARSVLSPDRARRQPAQG